MSDSDSCVLPDWTTLSFGIILTVGTSLSYLPQQIRIIRRKSSQGISPLYLFISAIFSFGSIISICLLQYSTFQCCKESTINFWECNGLLLNVYQIAVMPLNLGFIYTLSVLFVDPIPAPDDHPNPLKYEKTQKLQMFLSFGIIIFLFICFSSIGFILVIVKGSDSNMVIHFAKFVSLIVLISTFIQFVPQIYATFRYRKAGSVSVITLSIQAPGNLAVVVYQLLSGSAVATWLPFLSSFIQQTILIIEIFIFECIINKKKKEETQILSLLDDNNENNED